jgi:hypothetical protein
VAELLKQEFGVEVELVEGNKNEFTVLVDQQVVARNGWISFPTDQTIFAAVRQALAD